ncbi:hypothetical protein K458DRAFT_382599 [Lentithecium fluviatile CBS 122367]|uniref:Uncharacterized protein n=1 Tax=Lentithecium fluviatile CBS 122367 TaxID=1168545 RepID=A0A6G1JKD2_9PLEO|nr:hypothetical protein K458DRAFT_382599 [Lentithecium fluviatile CBS 122367]
MSGMGIGEPNHSERLSTELDTMILRCLPKGGLNNMCLTSRKYHERKIKLLFVSLVSLPNYIQCIRSFTLCPTNNPHYLKYVVRAMDPNKIKWLQSSTAATRKLIHIIVPNVHQDDAIRLLDKVCEDSPSFDAVLGLVLCSALRLQHLDLNIDWKETVDFPWTMKLLRCRWAPIRVGVSNFLGIDESVTDGQEALYPFCELKCNKLGGWNRDTSPQILVTPDSKSPTFCRMEGPTNALRPPLKVARHDPGTPTKLHTLVIEIEMFTPHWFEQLLACPHLRHLKCLIFSGKRDHFIHERRRLFHSPWNS